MNRMNLGLFLGWTGLVGGWFALNGLPQTTGDFTEIAMLVGFGTLGWITAQVMTKRGD